MKALPFPLPKPEQQDKCSAIIKLSSASLQELQEKGGKLNQSPSDVNGVIYSFSVLKGGNYKV